MSFDFSKYKAVVFDFDGTLYAPCRFGMKLVFSDLLYSLRSKRERNARKKLAGKSFANSAEFYDNFFSIIGQDKRDWYFNRYMPLMISVIKNKVVARPNVQMVIDSLRHRGMKVGCLSDYCMVKQRTEALGLRFDDDCMWSSEEIGSLKPSPVPFLHVANQLSVPCDQILMVGDRVDTDYLGAKAAGMDCVIIYDKKYEGSDVPLIQWADFVESACK